MAQIARRIRTLEAHGAPAPELVHAWVRWRKGTEGSPGNAALTPEERLKTAKAAATTGRSPLTVRLEMLQEVWHEEGPCA
jgi:hypothetical protein